MELIKTTRQDLEALFMFQTSKEGIWMAAFMPEDPTDREFYMQKWTKIIENPDIRMRTIWHEHKIVGSVAHFELMGETHVSYWIDQQHWGKGFATEGLKKLINESVKQPLVARVAYDNYGSQKVLEKCGFKQIGTDKGFANARKKEIEEFIYVLEE